MAKKKDSIQSNPNASSNQAALSELDNPQRTKEQAAPRDECNSAPQPELITLDFHEYGIEDALVMLLDMAKKGKINGLIFSARMTRRGGQPYLYGCEGRLLNNRAEAIGAAVLLQHSIVAM